jgi:hypothetical protein
VTEDVGQAPEGHSEAPEKQRFFRNTAKVATNWGASSVIYVNLSVLTTHVVASFALLPFSTSSA